MERMADEMNHIARKTRTETVSMKTLMSTDVFQDHESGSSAGSPYNNLNPLQFYFTLSVPLTVLTLLVWACLYQFEIRRAQMEEGKFIASKMA
ncbi:uncharacterized protein KY384_001175 [Bacidia gigantensis]|uniref:uncharacterized protein n=1 Tax=Bacidia gigantensis TaxID=2732470 RepID=UPI001D04549A|nr:uncharacterized protein KY384_001175 [Bacidia gigantensis]KAG8534331.1 hypothetical protein KY384_001175 [Bacidia gigantensis]